MVHGRLRIGPSEGPQVSGHVLARGGVDPLLARALADPALEAPSGFVARAATTGGTSLLVPWGRAVTTSGGVDVDLTTGELVLARAGVILRDRCQCVAVRANGSHRIGREGVDVWVVIDFASDR
jgi:hypothetical protein